MCKPPGENQTAKLDFALKPAEVATSVDVTGEAPLLQTETSSFGNAIDK